MFTKKTAREINTITFQSMGRGKIKKNHLEKIFAGLSVELGITFVWPTMYIIVKFYVRKLFKN